MTDGWYTPPHGEYIKPSGTYLFEVPSERSFDRHFVRGAVHHQNALAGHLDGAELLVELVPEPGNPYDPWAVAFHVQGRRIGYVGSEFADEMHEYIAGHNRCGRAVLARGQVKFLADETIAATVFLPWWRDQQSFREGSGVPAEARHLLASLPEDVRTRAMQTSQDLSASDAKKINALKRRAPHLVWTSEGGVQIPVAVRSELITMDKARKEAIRTAQALEWELARQAKQQEQAAKAKVKEELESAIRDLASQGVPKTSIARQLGCSETKVRSTLASAGVESTNANAASRDERLKRAHQALDLQRAGRTRPEIASKLECSLDTVKGMLKDAKFFDDPASDLPRLDRTLAVDKVSKTATLEEAASELGWTPKAVKAARGDAGVFKDHAWAKTKPSKQG